MTPPINGFGEVTAENAGDVLKREEFKNLSEKELQYLLAEKEKNKIIPKFEKVLYRQESDETWEIKTEKNSPLWIRKKQEFEPEKEVQVKINPQGDIKEYVSGVSKELIGKQLFSIRALKRLGLLNRLPADQSIIQDMIGEPPLNTSHLKEKYFNFLKENKQLMLPAYREPTHNKHHFNDGSYCWLANGSYVFFDNNYESWFYNKDDKDWFFPVCLLEETSKQT